MIGPEMIQSILKMIGGLIICGVYLAFAWLSVHLWTDDDNAANDDNPPN